MSDMNAVATKQDVVEITSTLGRELKIEMKQGFDQILEVLVPFIQATHDNFVRVDARFDRLEDHATRLEDGFDDLRERITNIEAQMRAMHHRMLRLEGESAAQRAGIKDLSIMIFKMDKRLSGMEKRLANASRHNQTEHKKIQKRLDRLQNWASAIGQRVGYPLAARSA